MRHLSELVTISEESMRRERILPDSARPWSASGPGWANAGVTAIAEDGRGNRRNVTLYAECFDPTVLRMGIEACGRLQHEFEAAFRKDGGKRKP